jgi:glycosyltransferase involved in cell wall biosynthesis
MVGPFPPAVGGLANNMALLSGSSLSRRFSLLPFSTAKRRSRVFPNRPHWDSLPYLLLHTGRLVGALLRDRPEALYLKATSDTGFLRDMVLMGVARLFGRPVLCHLHGRPMGRLFSGGGWTQWVTRRGLALADTVVVLSPGLAEAFGEMFPGTRLVPVPNVVDLERFPAPSPRPSRPRPVVLTVGRLSREKGTWDLLAVAAALAAQNVEAEFRLVGIGETAEEEKALRAEAERLGLGNTVRFLGVRRGSDLVREYREADLFFLPTHAEIFPNVVLEALASGLAVVTTDVPVIPEMFTHGEEGFLHAPGAVEDFVRSLDMLLADDRLRARMGSKARALAEARYGVETAARRIGDLLEELGA